MLGQLLGFAARIILGAIILGWITSLLAFAAIAISEILSQRRRDAAVDNQVRFAADAAEVPQVLNEEFLSLLACPVCKTSVRRENDRLICGTCGRRYPIHDGIPVMLVDEAEQPTAGTTSSE
jgi:uncharacterized protein YbaR (Trm112 family)